MRRLGTALWRFMVIFSFIVNFVLIVVLLVAGIFIFQIKNQVADPLIGGLHATAQGLEQSTIDWTIPVRDTIPVVLNIPLETNTSVVLTDPVPLNVQAVIDLPGLNANDVPAFVSLTLPRGLSLPVALDLDVPVNEDLDIALDVRAVIPLSQTQLDDPVETLGLLFEPLAIGLHNLPNSFGETGDFVSQALSGEKDLTTLLLDTQGNGFNSEPYQAWLGYSRTAGLNYDLLNQPVPMGNIAVPTGINPRGGIPALDALVRPQVYQDGEFQQRQPVFAAQADGSPVIPFEQLPPETYNGNMADVYQAAQQGATPNLDPDANAQTENVIVPPDTQVDAQAANEGQQPSDTQASDEELGIIPTPAG